MTTNLVIGAVCIVGLLAGQSQGPAPAAGAAGRWDATFYTNEGPRYATIVLTKAGDQLSGTIASELGEVPIAGTQKGADLSLSFQVDFGSGPVPIAMTGKLDGEVMTGSADVGGQMLLDWGAKRAKDAAPAAGVKPAEAAKPAADATPARPALDVSGPWVLEVTTGAGSGTPTITLEQKGETLSGRYSGQLGEAALTGTLKGTAISFQFPVDVQGTTLTVVYTGTVENDTMTGTVKLGNAGDGTFTGMRRK